MAKGGARIGAGRPKGDKKRKSPRIRKSHPVGWL